MRKFFEKIAGIGLALTMVVGMASTAGAVDGYNENNDPSTATDMGKFTFTKNYVLDGDTTNGVSPAEDFGIEIEKYKYENTSVEIESIADMPAISDFVVTTEKGKADAATGTATVDVTLPAYPEIGDYWYTVTETAGSTAGVTYDDNAYYLHVQVILNETTEENIRLVTLHKAESDNTKDNYPIADTKTNGVTNTYSNGSLTVSKTVTGTYGDKKKEFDVDVTFSYASTDGTNCPVLSEIAYSASSKIETSDWKYADGSWSVTKTITLTDSSEVTFKNIPYGVTYTVQEKSYKNDGYDVPKYTITAETGDSVTGTTWDNIKVTGRIDDATDTVDITNNKNANIDIGVILENAPYIIIMTIVLVAGVTYIVIRRKNRIKE